MEHSDHNAVLPGEGQSTGNDIDGDVSGTSIQAGSIGELHLNTLGEPLWRKGFRYLAGPAAAAGALALVTLSPSAPLVPEETANRAPAAAGPAESTVLSSPETTETTETTAGPPSTSTTAPAARPAPPGKTPRPARSTSTDGTPTSTTTVAPSPARTGVRFSGALRFGSFHLDLARPRDVPGTNVWRMPQNRLHGDDGYELAEWIADGVPGPGECAADLVKRATRDAENLIIGSRVCGKTPGGRIFRVDVAAIDGTTITGDVTVWEQDGQLLR